MRAGAAGRAPLIEHVERSTRRAVGLLERANGSLHGWTGSRLPLGSRVGGCEHIRVGRGFRPVGAVWIDAITTYEGEHYAPSIEIGPDFRCSPGLHISAIGRITIGANVLMGSHVFVGDHGHGGYRGDTPEDLTVPPYRRPLRSPGPVVIGDDCWLGDNVVVTGGVTIGRGSVVGANSVVTRDIPPHSVAVGAPAIPVRTLIPPAPAPGPRPA